MHKEILTDKQQAALPMLKPFWNKFGLVGGTAIALYLGHRESIDFDMASLENINSSAIRNIFAKSGKIEMAMIDSKDEYSILFKELRLTFFYYPFPIKFKKSEMLVPMPDLITLAAMKAYALGRRAKWKDYVDLYFIIKKYNSVNPIINKAKAIFKNEFNEKNFLSQLSYFNDIDYSEAVIFSKGFETADKTIKKELTRFSLNR